MRNILRVLLAVCALVLLDGLSRMPFTPEKAEIALLRLSWRTRGEALQQCRTRTAAELKALPEHMRTPQLCTGRVANYLLSVRIDGGAARTRELRAAGAHADRPIYVLWQESLAPGRHTIDIEFYSILHADRRGLRLHEDIDVKRGDIALVTHDDEHDRLYLKRERREHHGERDEDE
jgi:hypothetical protein